MLVMTLNTTLQPTSSSTLGAFCVAAMLSRAASLVDERGEQRGTDDGLARHWG